MSKTAASEEIIIIGAGVAGLFCALMLQTAGQKILILERDPLPPNGAEGQASLNTAFCDWHRRGVGQLRHSHAFLARLINSVRDRHPRLLRALTEAGCREVKLVELLPSTLKARYVHEPADEDLSILMSRRTTFELVLRRYVEALDGVEIRSNTFVSSYLFDPSEAGLVLGVQTQAGESLYANYVIDAAGRGSQVMEWLEGQGVLLEEGKAAAGILYYTRHWRLRPGQIRPQPTGSPGAGDLGYLKYGLFEADNGWFSVTLAVPEVESELRQAMLSEAVFDKICRALPGVSPWIDKERSEPQTKVFAMGELRSLWRRMVKDGRPLAKGLFLVGDSLIQSNPLYGRGTTFAVLQAELLAKAFRAASTAEARAVLYDSLVDQALRPFFEEMAEQDRSGIHRAKVAREGRSVSMRGQLMRSFIRDGAGIAVRDDLNAFRAALRGFHMLDPPRAWLREPRHIGVVLRTWARGKRRNAHLYPGKMGPDRAEMLALLGLTQEGARARQAA